MSAASRSSGSAAAAGRNLEPGMATQATGTSAARRPRSRARSASSRSKAHLWRCSDAKRCLPACARKSLKPHCVSRSGGQPARAERARPKQAARAFSARDRPAASSALRWQREPKAICAPPSWSCRPSACSSRSTSRMLVEPSASAISSSCPLAASMPTRTAKPLPRFATSFTTRSSPWRGERSLCCDPTAAAKVPSVLPSSTTMTS
mmetsp:Transcript_40069/g.127533  ORF Transcript_40069/g.127533 Transcript_40069/m.127533 type:complete len:207 (+) Transcript_40069:131-751(+)